jgi:hypothetical protein
MGEFDYKGFMQDFRIADCFGVNAVKDTFNRAHEEWKNNADYYASFVMTLNHLIWFHYERGNMTLAKVYDTLWKKADAFVYKNFKGEELQKIIEFLD